MTDLVINHAGLRAYFVRLYWPVSGHGRALRIDAIDAWDANALARLNHSKASVACIEAWDDNRHPQVLAFQHAEAEKRHARERELAG